MKHVALVLCLVLLAGCSNPISNLLGGGPKVAANVQAGKTNTQTIGQTSVTEQKIVRPQARSIEQSTGTTKVRTERVETVIVEEKDAPWLIWSLVLSACFGVIGWIHGWNTPSPSEIGRRMKKRKNP